MVYTTTNSSTLQEKDLKIALENMDQFFLVTNGIIVLIMQPGFALLESGLVRSKNATNIFAKNILDALLAGIAFWLIGYAFAYGEGNFFCGLTYFANYGLPPSKYAHWFFQYVFAATASTIVSGSLAERCEPTAYFTYSSIITGFIYPVVAHWAWTDEGWLHVGTELTGSYHDFAGSGVVHLTGGTCALVGAYILGPRIGRFDGIQPKEIRGHSMPLAITGGMLLMVGFLAFNGGSRGSISNIDDGIIVSQSICNTVISGCFGGLVAIVLVRAGIFGRPRVISVGHGLNGALVGMVSICSGVDKMHMWAAAVVGTVATLFYMTFHVLVRKLKIDDPLDAVAVHLGGGLWGVLAAPLLRFTDGVIINGTRKSAYGFLWNLTGACAIIFWCGALSVVMFGVLKLLGALRVDAEIEIKGLDLMKHNEPAYPAESWFEEQYQDASAKARKRSSVTPYDIGLPPNMRAAKLTLDNLPTIT